MKTRKPLILTARMTEEHLQAFDQLRTAHFPPDRNHIRAHLTTFHRLPGEYMAQVLDDLADVVGKGEPFMATVTGLRHLGAGVAFTIESSALEGIRALLKARFKTWLGPQDLQKWQPHVTVQNKVSGPQADALYDKLRQDFAPYPIGIVGLDLWQYLGGPWLHLSHAPLGGESC